MLEHVDLSQLLILDIETVPQYPSYQEVPEIFKDQRKDETAEEYYPRAGIWAEFGKIVCISVGIFTRENDQTGLRVKSFASDDECKILTDFTTLLNKQPSSLILCAHNGKEFDFPYICRRTLVNQLCIPTQLRISGKKPWEINHLDTLDLWKFGDYKNYTSLNLLAAIFDIATPKDDISGSDVHWVYWKDHDLTRISTYCQKDVVTTAQLIMKFKNLPSIENDHISIVE
jgi:DNA polymerase elongation subunit (family B)